jgi:multiple sugar transport system permease protein
MPVVPGTPAGAVEAPLVATAAKPRRRVSLRRRETFAFYGFLSPWLLGFIALTSVPLVLGFAMSLSNLTTVNLHTDLRYVGADNYVRAYHDHEMWYALKRTGILMVTLVPLWIVTQLALAMILNAGIKFLGLWRTLFYIAVVIPVVAKAFMWKAIAAADGGLINRVLGALGGSSRVDWLLDHPTTTLVMLLVWGGAGSGMLIFLAGLKSIPEELYEVARIDGANALRRFTAITLPLLTPVIMFQLVWGLVGAANVFIEPILLAPGIQQGVSSSVPTDNVTINLYALQRIFVEGDFGYGAAIAWIFIALLLVITALVFLSGRFWVFYAREQHGR